MKKVNYMVNIIEILEKYKGTLQFWLVALAKLY